MLDMKFIRENPDLLKQAISKRHYSFDLERLLKIDEARRALIKEVEALREEQNKASENFLPAGRQGSKDKLDDLKQLKESLQKKEAEFSKIDEEFRRLMLLVPNIPDPTVPEGKSDEDNVEIRKVGEPKNFNFKIRDHHTLLRELDLVDLERGTKVSGFRGYFLKNEGALLSMALWQFALDYLVQKGFTPFIAPSLVKENIFIEAGKLPLFREDLYATDDNLFLVPSAEIPMMGYHENEILLEEELPKKYVAFSPCYRREAGSYGKDEKGVYRLHEFMKVEQIILCKAEHQESVRWHEELTKYSEEILQALELPYRVVINCAGDLPFGFVKMYDIEAWIPSEKRYRESHSSSIVHDFQTRRLKIRYKSADGKTRFAHSLNNTAIATPRILQSLLENHQIEDGSVLIPEVLRKYIGKDVITPRSSKNVS
ncbi:serine--tRNA ligase [Candidatus Giovannonibacteria bacterium RIFCSPLOWO2_02_FULL_45_14]|uniref:Serine--tRNA ligase n=1 Tax=Candidatus Giovannonibacteria bacterium RIFCSPLOWO2_12_FULL_44_15 TaxID=1798364 RepID=A0A1F5XZE7_9BACT|nr:MAG: serine--tRNA ligase [Candidatus Giovannonibacteria bacterium RIFCSPHIGHO2_02_FULL_44_31]OGF77074.1 MAG: serine--tRNA ligase [Candidatus Giovannonibacteria bacterium RIFCSPHIGHO2_12_FULL_44_29]OGF90827.1 MAG: serine--tRNA ligase [Candidatus Giovannonibacteria bacterium RIFCSPLOWO2_02_FULL_45_14]OGF93253.1 MAG: serine--tRNA ligase [Candidatus Giovannonibacteria bacterium RIFCSPLOWO2_12_FULL_44_15]